MRTVSGWAHVEYYGTGIVTYLTLKGLRPVCYTNAAALGLAKLVTIIAMSHFVVLLKFGLDVKLVNSAVV